MLPFEADRLLLGVGFRKMLLVEALLSEFNLPPTHREFLPTLLIPKVDTDKLADLKKRQSVCQSLPEDARIAHH